jgi:hypothetical protein
VKGVKELEMLKCMKKLKTELIYIEELTRISFVTRERLLMLDKKKQAESLK